MPMSKYDRDAAMLVARIILIAFTAGAVVGFIVARLMYG